MREETFQVSRICKVEGDTKLKAFADVSVAGILIKGFRIVEGSNGTFLGMPRHQGKDGRWYNTVYPTTKELQKELSDVVLSAYGAQ